LVSSSEFEELLKYHRACLDLGSGPFVIRVANKKEIKVENLEKVAQTIIDLSKEGMVIQRYKGLGEMNPEQLWETTMDPSRRTLLKVTIDDAVQADAIFSILMGDQVEPRRKFIEENALRARYLDI
jgi:DNA gyrase subunit B